MNETRECPPILVWPGRCYPERFRAVIENHSDIDWVAFVPECYRDDYIGWLMDGGPFGCCAVNEYDVDGGYIAVGHHS